MTDRKKNEPASARPRDVLSAEARARYEQAMRDWLERLSADAEAVRESERLAEGDFAIRINARD